MRIDSLARQHYMLSACIINASQSKVNNLLLPLVPHGARKLHWYHMESHMKYRSMLALEELDATYIITDAVEPAHMRAERARRKCMEQMLRILESFQVDVYTLESRNSRQDQMDLDLMLHLRRSFKVGNIRLEHLAGSKDSRLWVPDQLLGIYGDVLKGNQSHSYFIDNKALVEKIAL